jgi:hypothetical protein
MQATVYKYISLIGFIISLKAGTGCFLIIIALGRLRQEDHEFQMSLSYIVSSRLTWAI